MKKLLFALLLLLPGSVWAQEVYQEILFEGVTGNALMDSLALHYKPATVLNYNNARDLMFSEIYNVDGINVCVYTADTIEIPFGDPNPRTIANAHDPNWNTEHVYPQSKGAGSGNARTDLHHLMPTRGDVNSSRGNSPFGFVADENVTNWWNSEGSHSTKPSGDPATFSKAMGSSRFEPRDAVKGTLARAVFYFYTMYRAEAIDADPAFFQVQYEALREFHNLDPVDAIEVDRTFQIADVQDGKPNPFVIDTTLVRRVFFEDFDFDQLPQHEDGYLVDFDNESKQGYAESFISLNGLTWRLDNVLIGSDINDLRSGTKSARGRHETDTHALLQMEEDKTDGLGTISFLYARSNFSGDRNPEAPVLVVEYSMDGGITWTQTGQHINLDGVDELTTFESEVKKPGDGRIRIRSISGTNGRRFNIDTILITNYIETEAELAITGREGWRMLTSPVKAVTLSELLDDIFTQGFPGADDESEQYASNVYWYDEVSQSYKVPESINQQIEPGTGYIVYIFENDDPDLPVTGDLNRSISLIGEEPGDFDHPMSFTANGDPVSEGWNLLGNPFNTALSVSELELYLEQDINDNLYIWDANAGTNGEYIILSSGDIEHSIAPFQGFWVKTESADQAFPFTKDAATDNGTFHKAGKTDLSITLQFNGNFEFANSSLIFSETGSELFISRDAYSLMPISAENAQSYFIKEGIKLSHAYFPAVFEGELQIPFSISSAVSLDGFIEADISGNSAGWSFILEQVSTGNQWNISNENVPYQFMAKTAELNPLKPSHPSMSKLQNDGDFILRVSNSTAVSNETENPLYVSLGQNYPNPFNPSTTIGYSVPSQQHVKIEVFDMLGRRVSVLLNDTVQPGHHELTFNASSLSSGVYLYRLSTAGQSFTRRLTLIK